MIPNISKNDFLIINGLPFIYWIYKFTIEQNVLIFLLLVIGAFIVINMFYYREDILYKLKSGLTTRDFAKFVKKRPFFIIGALFSLLYGPLTWLNMLIFDEKNYFLWSIFILWVITEIYFFLSIRKPRYKKKMDQIKHFMRRGKK